MRRIDKEEVRRNLIELRQLTLEVTDDCNLSCRYCGYGEMYEWYDERQSKYLRFGQIEKLLDFLTGLWNSNESVSSNPHTFISFYGGEPLLNMPLICQVVDYMREEVPVFDDHECGLFGQGDGLPCGERLPPIDKHRWGFLCQ